MLRDGVPVLAVALVGALLAGCQRDAQDSGTRASAGSSASASDSAPTSAATSAATASTGPDDRAPAASGALVDLEFVSFRYPDPAWAANSRSGDSASFSQLRKGIWLLSVSEMELGLTAEPSLEEAARHQGVGDPLVHDGSLRRGEDRQVGGVDGFTASTVLKHSTTPKFDTEILVWGTVVRNHYVTIELEGPVRDPRTREWFEAVLASVV